MPIPITAPHARQRGSTLLEALVAFLVLSLGMLAVARLQSDSRLHADVSRQRSEAVRLAQADIEALRAFAGIDASAGERSYEEIDSGAFGIDAAIAAAAGTVYRITRQVVPATPLRAKAVTVAVDWTDRNGGGQQVVLDTLVAGIDPALGGALALARRAGWPSGALGRAASIPLAAKDLGGGRSALKPVADGSVAYVFDNKTGRVVARCGGVDPAVATHELTTTELGRCDSVAGLWLDGSVRFSLASPPDAAAANDPPLAMAVAIALTGSGYAGAPECFAQPLKTVRYTAGGSEQRADVPIAATPASLALADWTDTGERRVAYGCVVYPQASGQWSGRTTLVPIGWTLGAGTAERRVCRYSADLDASGAIDANIEHPADYVGVAAALPNQNFLVIRGNELCPPGRSMPLTGGDTNVFADLSTAPHQP